MARTAAKHTGGKQPAKPVRSMAARKAPRKTAPEKKAGRKIVVKKRKYKSGSEFFCGKINIFANWIESRGAQGNPAIPKEY